MTAGEDPPTIRPFHPSDLPALYRICLATGADGGDAGADFEDPDLLGHVYAGPYAVLEPDLCLVLDLAGRTCGYVLGTADTAAFAQRCQDDWFPALRRRHPLPPAGDESRDASLIRLLHRGLTVDPLAARFPAHLHIDLLPAAAGRGAGRALLATFLDRLRERGVPGVHLGVSTANLRAQGFYRRIGFGRLRSDPGTEWFGLPLTRGSDQAAGDVQAGSRPDSPASRSE